jgi:hypothetical protein
MLEEKIISATTEEGDDIVAVTFCRHLLRSKTTKERQICHFFAAKRRWRQLSSSSSKQRSNLLCNATFQQDDEGELQLCSSTAGKRKKTKQEGDVVIAFFAALHYVATLCFVVL